MDLELAGGAWGVGRAVAGRDPFYLLSAFSMLLGYWILSRALALEPGHAGKLVLLIGVLNLYEAPCGLALFLIVRRGSFGTAGRCLWWIPSSWSTPPSWVRSSTRRTSVGGLFALGLFLLTG